MSMMMNSKGDELEGMEWGGVVELGGLAAVIVVCILIIIITTIITCTRAGSMSGVSAM